MSVVMNKRLQLHSPLVKYNSFQITPRIKTIQLEQSYSHFGLCLMRNFNALLSTAAKPDEEIIYNRQLYANENGNVSGTSGV